MPPTHNQQLRVGDSAEFEIRHPDGTLKERFRVTKQEDGTTKEEILYKEKQN